MSTRGLGKGIRLHAVPSGIAAALACHLSLLLPAVSTASDGTGEPPARAAHVRGLDDCGSRLLDEALRRSAIVRGLVERLDASDIIVYLSSAPPLRRPTGMPRGKTQFLSANPAGRFLQIWVDPAQRPAVRIAVLAHELQHALEVAAASEVSDIDSFTRLYEGLGSAGHTTGAARGVRRYETAAAVAVEASVLQELEHGASVGATSAER